MKGIYLLLGSNLGDNRTMLQKAARLIDLKIGKIINSSSIYRTKAWGISNQPDFLNQVMEVESLLSAPEILTLVNKIEKQLGRVRHIKWHARLIDIDILYYGSQIINTETLVVPHPENENRNFVLVPMVELAPDLLHPVNHLTQQQLLDQCRDELDVEKID